LLLGIIFGVVCRLLGSCGGILGEYLNLGAEKHCRVFIVALTDKSVALRSCPQILMHLNDILSKNKD
jgi:hypothetical protein